MAELNVVAKIRIMPEGVETNLEGISEKVKGLVGDYGKVHSSEIKPIAFGLNSLEVTLLLSDKEGGLEEIEEKVLGIEGVTDFTVLDINRL